MIMSQFKIWPLFLLLFISTTMYAQKPVFDHLSIHVNHLERSVAFYTDLFKLDSISDPFPNYRVTWLKLTEQSQLHIFEDKSTIPRSKYHFCFRVSSLEDFIELLNTRGIPFFNGPGKKGLITTRTDGVRQIYFYDPDGHKLEINDRKI